MSENRQNNPTQEQFHAWLETQSPTVKKNLLSTEKMYEDGRKSLLSDSPTTYHEVINYVYDQDLIELYRYSLDYINLEDNSDVAVEHYLITYARNLFDSILHIR